MVRIFAYVAAVAIVIAAGVLHGDRSGRWGASLQLQRAAARLEAVPRSFGDWRSVDFELDPRQVEMGEIAGYVARRYENSERDASLTILLLCGRPGPVSAHTPEWCYGGAGYHAEGQPAVETVEDATRATSADFRTALFTKQEAATPEALQIDWAWNAGQGWEAPENPRLAFAPRRSLYKLYIVRDATADTDDDDDGPEVSRAFLRQFLPVVDEALDLGEAAGG